eukprot:823875-Pyramimonas_sp.AAC.1
MSALGRTSRGPRGRWPSPAAAKGTGSQAEIHGGGDRDGLEVQEARAGDASLPRGGTAQIRPKEEGRQGRLGGPTFMGRAARGVASSRKKRRHGAEGEPTPRGT